MSSLYYIYIYIYFILLSSSIKKSRSKTYLIGQGAILILTSSRRELFLANGMWSARSGSSIDPITLVTGFPGPW